MLSILHKQLLNNFQQEFPLSPRPFQDIANILGVSEDEVLSAYRELDKLHSLLVVLAQLFSLIISA